MDKVCAICRDDLGDGHNEMIDILACGHEFHAMCVFTYLETHGGSAYKLPCPVCKMTPEALRVVEEGLLASHGGSGTGGGGSSTPQAISDDADSPPPSHVAAISVGESPSHEAGDDIESPSHEAGDDIEDIHPLVEPKATAKAAESIPKAKATGPKTRAKAKALSAPTPPPAISEGEADPATEAKAAPKRKAKAKASALPTVPEDEQLLHEEAPAAAAKAAPKPACRRKAKAKASAVPDGPEAAAKAAKAGPKGKAAATALPAPASGEGQAGPKSKAKVGPQMKAKAKALPANVGRPLLGKAAGPPAKAKALPASGADATETLVAVSKAEPPIPMVGSDSGAFAGNVQCNSCKRYTHFRSCRVLSKDKGTWRCSACGVKTQQLRRVFGSWPTDAFTCLAPAAQEAFYRDVDGTCLALACRAARS